MCSYYLDILIKVRGIFSFYVTFLKKLKIANPINGEDFQLLRAIQKWKVEPLKVGCSPSLLHTQTG